MQIVFISWWWPYPPNNGSKIRAYHLLANLAQAHDVTLLSFADEGEATPDQIAHVQTFCQRVEVVPKPTYKPGSLKAQLGYFSRWPRSLLDVYSPQMAQLVAQYGAPADVVIACQMQTMRYLELVPDKPRILEEIEVTGFHDLVAAASGQASRLRAQLTLTKMKNSLGSLLEQGTVMTVVSDKEQAYLETLAVPDARISVIPNGVDSAHKQPDPDVRPQPHTLIYPGAVTYGANYDAVQYFVEDVLPLVQAKHPDVTFTVTGGTGQVDIKSLAARPGVYFTGFLPEVEPKIRQSWATVVPLREGGGTRLKILESMALGTPVIATTKGAEGLAVQSGRDILIADSPPALAEAIDRLLADADLRASLSQAGRTLVTRTYDWSIMGRQLLDLVEDVVQSKVTHHG
jgi:polysaccharide biosynthesis protein PslH